MRLRLIRPNRFLVLCMLCMFGVHFTAAQTQIAKESSIESIIEKKMNESGTVGLGAAIIVNKKVVWIKAYGYADKDNKVPFTPNTIINIGSISKTFTGVSLMQAVEDRRVSLDEDGQEVPKP